MSVETGSRRQGGMTWTWTLPIEIHPSSTLATVTVEPSRVRVVMPTYRDWDDARTTVESLLNCSPRPGEVVVANDNEDGDCPTWVRRWGIRVASYSGNRGPAFARNAGARLEGRSKFDWLCFTDTACTRSADFFERVATSSSVLPRTCVAMAAPVLGVGYGPINRYMTEEAILAPPRDAFGPQAVVTANATVSLRAFEAVGGFDAEFRIAGGEDLDLGLRLRSVGPIAWCDDSPIHHGFEESLDDFDRRFERYGRGNAQLALKWGFRSMEVDAITARDPALQYLADRQVAAMRRGYSQLIAR